ncbi:hypothetical protein [Silvimonas sp.]|uniref:hypothetical protein n=1 Tax=Silvimonas sp. TaxID=2650811 RepID=UPI00283F3543|nr:hypothetical protein [Silvimonas sp.]MDR3428014.1 hypothetical protein [Silvimonas sp.]
MKRNYFVTDENLRIDANQNLPQRHTAMSTAKDRFNLEDFITIANAGNSRADQLALQAVLRAPANSLSGEYQS